MALADIRVGMGSADITGPVFSKINMIGHGNIKQTPVGLRTRLFSKAVIVEDVISKDRIVLVLMDHCFVPQAVFLHVLNLLKAKFGELYTFRNVIVSATHSHSSPGGISQAGMYVIGTNLAFDRHNFEIVTQGIVKSIVLAHDALEKKRRAGVSSQIFLNAQELDHSSWNRSPEAQEKDPDRNGEIVDKKMTVLKVVTEGKEEGMLNWFAVHPTSYTHDFRLVDGDNKRYAALLFERRMPSPFQAFFFNSNCGDVACERFNLDEYDRAVKMGENQDEKAFELFEKASEDIEVSGRPQIFSRSAWIKFPGYSFDDPFVKDESGNVITRKICAHPAAGWPLAVGAADHLSGLKVSDVNASDPTIEGDLTMRFALSGYSKLMQPSEEDKACHFPKNIMVAFDTESFSKRQLLKLTASEKWVPDVLPFQVFVMGSVALVSIPSEITTIAGRRLRAVVENSLQSIGVKHVFVQAYSNTYIGYITTAEEYGRQAYEGAHCLYGPNSLGGMASVAKALAQSIAQGRDPELSVASAPPAPILSSYYDDPPFPKAETQKDFGRVIQKPPARVVIPEPGNKNVAVEAVFSAGDPRLSSRVGDTFLAIEKKSESGWETFLTDKDFETDITWPERGGSTKITWRVSSSTPPGIYRIKHFGEFRAQSNTIYSYEGASGEILLMPHVIQSK